MAPHFSSRLRKGATATTVAALAVAAMTASQAPDAMGSQSPQSRQAADATPPAGTPVSGDSPYFTDLPPLNTPATEPAPPATTPAGTAEAGIPASVLAAYRKAEQTVAGTDPGCHLPWQLLAAIGKVESGQARGGRVDAQGTTLTPILGPVLNGAGFANISDTDNGQYDGDATHDRAVGPMQFIPSTWATWGQDGNGDGKKDPDNVFDASLATGRYLCADGRDVAVQHDLDQAILGYNHSQEYLSTVLSWFGFYKKGSHGVPDGTGVLPAGTGPDGQGPGAGDNSPGKGGSSSRPAPATPSASARPTPEPAKSGSGTVSPVPGPSRSGKPSPSPSGSGGPSGKPSPSPSGSGCPSGSPSPSPSDSASPTPSPSPSGSASPSPSATPSPSGSPSGSPSPSPSPSGSSSPKPCSTG
ncbi:lytic transglycosylase domain-containing protein [Streptomyces sp. NBC_00859]|uniref:lytic transglycosylase domain-containing protein n=1 Tax=Streptomyces sp. NBC_00859 TaxID=2903682 RepID=UPI00386EDFAB|nr:lytic transglycosylase domain-containing protein [Streptomyces sp. NBC_00859]